MSDLIVRSDDERLVIPNNKCLFPSVPDWPFVAMKIHLLRDSLRASLQREEAERAERDEMKVERDAALLRVKAISQDIANLISAAEDYRDHMHWGTLKTLNRTISLAKGVDPGEDYDAKVLRELEGK